MKVSKYSASGNDFVIFHSFVKKDRSDLAIKLCDRHEGVGADGLIVLLPHEKYDFQWQFYNSDGSEASMCGNGTRACALYAYQNDLADEKMNFLTGAGAISASICGFEVESALTKPITLKEPFEEEGRQWHFYDTGVPHLVTYCDDLQKEWDMDLAKKMRQKYNANVNFANLNQSLHVRTYERGVEDETKACGTGMVACFLGLNLSKKIGNKIQVIPKSGELLEVRKDGENLYFKGKVRHTFDGIVKV
ncbi:MAG: diaminopimelate epimerase [Proteobacteria bacterium]|nr:MAG: diaminopimelate epimerase [Pseudomonadota bacterium]